MMRKLWLRLGVSIQITEAEEKIILDSDCEIAEVIRTIIAEGRFALDGDSYIPDESIEEFNETYGTDYDEGEIGFDC